MGNLGWSDNGFEGRALRRSIKRTLKLAEKHADNPTLHTQYLRTAGYLMQIKFQLAKFEVERDIEQRLERLETLANIAKQGKISR